MEKMDAQVMDADIKQEMCTRPSHESVAVFLLTEISINCTIVLGK